MEQVQGTSLAAWLRAMPRSAREVLDAFRQAGAGLAAAHGAGVLHRDFKPDNVLVGNDGTVRVTDFGLARSLDDASTAAGTVVGTPAYMAPEQVAGHVVEPAADQFSFCMALRESLQVVRDPGQVPEWVAPLVTRGLALHPAHRHPSMSALVAELTERLEPRIAVQLRVNALLQLLAFAIHVMLVAVFARYIATHDEGPSTPSPRGDRRMRTRSRWPSWSRTCSCGCRSGWCGRPSTRSASIATGAGPRSRRCSTRSRPCPRASGRPSGRTRWPTLWRHVRPPEKK